MLLAVSLQQTVSDCGEILPVGQWGPSFDPVRCEYVAFSSLVSSAVPPPSSPPPHAHGAEHAGPVAG